jgi:uncharacterized protein (TIGR02588 family)
MTPRTKKQGSSEDEGEQTAISLAEWIAVGISAAIVIGAVATLLLHAPRDRTPPDLVVTVDRVDPVTAGFLVRFTVENKGGTTAAHVVVRGESRGTAASEDPEAVFDYVPDGSRRRGGLLFIHDPRQTQLTVRAVGYREP